MLFKTREDFRKRRCSQLFIWCVLLAFTVSASATMPDKRVPKRAQHQELSLEDRFEAEQRLSDIGYWTGPIDGTLDPAFRHALIAFQKIEGRRRTGVLTKDDLEAIRSAKKPLPRQTGDAHIEIDLDRQVLFMVDASGSITHIIPVCTGNEKSYVDHGQTHRAHTPRGKFTVLRKLNGWRRSSLGLLYYPNYIHEGIAIHGSLAIAVYPDSHGCIRIPMFASKELSEMTPVGTEVIVYESGKGIALR